jgi:hypothetical protein
MKVNYPKSSDKYSENLLQTTTSMQAAILRRNQKADYSTCEGCRREFLNQGNYSKLFSQWQESNRATAHLVIR